MNTSGSQKNQPIADVAAEIAERTSQIAQADGRFGRDFTQFIPGFEGADAVAHRLMALPECSAARRVLVTPDNSVAKVRQMVIQGGTDLIVPSYGLHRGFLEIRAGTVPEAAMRHAGWLDAIEYYGVSLTLDELVEGGPIDLIVTGASAVSRQGLRFGMGDFYLDIEWAILRALDLVDDHTLVIACVHEVQLSDLSLGRQPFNLTVNLIVTPSEIHQAAPRGGEARAVTLDWSIVPPSLMQTSPLQEFRRRAARAANQSSTRRDQPMDHKASVRSEVFAILRTVALPDSRFHFDFGEFIADFEGSDQANQRLVDHQYYRNAKVIFITPDNCLEQLRYRALLDGKTVLTTSYSIKRGFWLLKREDITDDKLLYASTLDGMERVGKPMSLQQIAAEIKHVDFLVTGTGAINEEGVRFGKGHGFFDAEWGMLHRMGVITTATPAAAVVHDCQVLQQILYPEVFDTVADVVFTPTRTLEVASPHKPDCGIVWSLLDPHMLETIPPLQELKELESRGLIAAE